MKIGKSIMVGGATYKIKLDKNLKDDDNQESYGYVRFATLEIILNPSFGEETTAISLFHELEHVKDYHLGLVEGDRVKIDEVYTVQRQYLQKQIVDQIMVWQK